MVRRTGPKHRRPIEPSPSKLIAIFAEEIAANSNGVVIDVACGYGRNAAYIASFGVPVICVDINNDALAFIKSGVNVTTAKLNDSNLLIPLKLDLINNPLPFKDESVGAILMVDFFNSHVLEHVSRLLKIGGYFLMETIDGRGGNYLDLPTQGYVKSKLADIFDFRYFKEKKVGPSHCDAATIKLLAIKQKSYNRC